MDYVLVTPSLRWQITLPKKVRELVSGMRAGVPLKIYAKENKIVAEPIVEDALTIQPKYSREEYLKILAPYEKNKQIYWTARDDKKLAELKKKDYKYLDW